MSGPNKIQRDPSLIRTMNLYCYSTEMKRQRETRRKCNLAVSKSDEPFSTNHAFTRGVRWASECSRMREKFHKTSGGEGNKLLFLKRLEFQHHGCEGVVTSLEHVLVVDVARESYLILAWFVWLAHYSSVPQDRNNRTTNILYYQLYIRLRHLL